MKKFTGAEAYKNNRIVKEVKGDETVWFSSENMTADEFTQMRKHGPFDTSDPRWIDYTIGGSDVGTIMEINPYKTKLELFYEKREDGIHPREPEVHSAATKMRFAVGHAMEPYVKMVINRDMMPSLQGWRVIEDNFVYQHPEIPNIICNIDGLIVSPEGELYILEVKTSNGRNFQAMKNYEEGILPLHYDYQVRTYMATLGIPRTLLVHASGLFPDTGFIAVECLRDLEIEHQMLAKIKKFIEACRTNTPPHNQTGYAEDQVREAANRIYGRTGDDGKIATLSASHFGNKFIEYSQAVEEIKSVEKKYKELMQAELEDRELLVRRDALEAEFRDAMDDAATARIEYPNGAEGILTYKSTEVRTVDKRQLEADGLLDQYSTVSSRRTFRLKKGYTGNDEV